MKSNLITRMIVTCLCMWAIGMAADQNQEIKSINEGVKTQAKVEANVELQKKLALKEKALLQTDIKVKQKATAYQNAKKEATIKVLQDFPFFRFLVLDFWVLTMTIKKLS